MKKVDIPWRLIGDRLSGGLTTALGLFKSFFFGKWAGTVFATLWLLTVLQLWGERSEHKRELKTKVAVASQKATTKAVQKVEQATTKEVERRVEVLKRVQVRSKADVKELDDLHTRLLNMQEVAKHEAEQTPDRDALSAASVLRIDRFR